MRCFAGAEKCSISGENKKLSNPEIHRFDKTISRVGLVPTT